MQALSQLSYTPYGKNNILTYCIYFYYCALLGARLPESNRFVLLASPRGFEPRYSP